MLISISNEELATAKLSVKQDMMLKLGLLGCCSVVVFTLLEMSKLNLPVSPELVYRLFKVTEMLLIFSLALILKLTYELFVWFRLNHGKFQIVKTKRRRFFNTKLDARTGDVICLKIALTRFFVRRCSD